MAQADLTLGAAGALDDFTGDVKADGADTVVTLDGANETAATFSGSGTIEMDADQTLTATGALNEVTGKVQVNDSYTLTLEGVNTVQAALTGSGDIAAEADQSFTGNVSAFTGSYNAAANVGVTFTGASTLATDMELNGLGKFTFESQDADVNVTSDASATTLCINDNNITLNSGVFADITGVTGSELIINSGITAGEVTVDALVINGGKSLSADQVTANSTYVYILNPGEQGPAITVNGASEFGDISVNSWSSAFTTPFTIVDSVTGQSYTDTVVFILGAGAGTGLTVDGLAQEIDGKFVRVYTQDGDLLIGNYNNTSNVVYVNSDWSTVTGTVEKWTVSATGSANDTDRIIGLDASKTLENAVAILRADANGSGTVYVVKGDTYSTPDALMTADNGVNSMVIEGKGFTEYDSTQAEIDLGDAVIEGGVVAMESAMSGSLTLKNVSVDGNVIGGAVVSADAGSASDTTSLTLDGGYYMASQITGGSHVTAGTYTVGSSELVIQNTTDEEMVVLGRVVGGSVVAGANAVVNQESASVTVDASNALTIRGDIYAAGSNIGNGTLNVDNTSVTFTGNAANLTFTGRVSGAAYREAIGSVDRNSDLVFANFDGMFKGLIQDFDTITISGNSSLEFSRKQTLTANTDLVFDLAGRTATDAMFTVNSFGWTYGDSITINRFDGISGDYVLVDNWDSAYDVNFTIGGTAITVGGSAVTVGGNEYKLVESGDTLVLSYVGNNGVGITNGANVSFADQVIEAGTDGNALSFGGSSDKVSADVALTGTTVDGNVHTGWYGNLTFSANGDTTINGDIDGYASKVDFTVESGKTVINGAFDTGNGADTLIVSDSAELEVAVVSTGNGADLIEVGAGSKLTVATELNTGNGVDDVTIGAGAEVSVDKLWLGNGADTLTVGENATLTVGELNGGIDTDTLILEKGAVVNVNDFTQVELMTINVDAVLNADDYRWSTKPLTVTGVADLTTDVAGAKTIFTNCVANKAIDFDGVDAVLGTATQIAGTSTVDTGDDVWASLTRVNGDLVVAWGRSEVEAGAALDAFKADSTLNLGEALVAVDDSLLDGFDSTDNLTKKNNGTLA